MKTSTLIKNLLWSLTGVITLTWISCDPPYFGSIQQPGSAELNSEFITDIYIERYAYGTEAGRIASRIGLQIPPAIMEAAKGSDATPYTLVFGIMLPQGWTVDDSIAFIGDDSGIFVYSDSLSGEQNYYDPPDPDYFWWVAETAGFMNVEYGTIFFTPVITTGNQPGNFFLDYTLGYSEGGYYTISSSYSQDHVVTCGLPDTVYVTSTANQGPGSLRDAIDKVDYTGTILFDLDHPATIYLAQEINLYKNLTIVGPESCNLWISGSNTCRVFNIPAYQEVHLSNMRVINGYGGGIYCGSYSSGTLTNLIIENNSAGEYGNGGGIYFSYSGSWSLSGLTIRSNSAATGGGIYCSSGPNVAFDPVDRCSIYSNSADLGADLYGGCSGLICLDKFTVCQPNDYFAYPYENYNGFNIQQCLINQADQDVYVSPAGSDLNSGITPYSPFRTISHALAMTVSNPEDPHTIHLAAGTYSAETNGEHYPLYLNSHLYLSGQGVEQTFLNSTGSIMRIAGDMDVRLENLSLSGGIDLSNSETTVSNFALGNSNSNVYCYASTLEMMNGSIRMTNGSNYILNGQAGSNLFLNHINIRDNASPVLNLNNSIADLDSCSIVNNLHPTKNLISLAGSSFIDLSGTTIHNNNSIKPVMSFSGSSGAFFDTLYRCNIYTNLTNNGREIMQENYTGSVIPVVLDTFSVLHPNDYHVYPVNGFTFDILHSIADQQVSQDIYVSLDGSDENSGLTPDDPLRTITRACRLYYPSENSRDTIHLAEGIFHLNAPDTMPLYLADGLTFAGAGRNETRITGTGSSGSSMISVDKHQDVTLCNLRLAASDVTPLQVNSSEVFLDQCDIRGSYYGIRVNGTSQITGDSAIISDNQYYGIYADNSLVVLKDLYVRNNGRSGVYIKNGQADINNLSIMYNGDKDDFGSGLQANNTKVTLMNSFFSGNASNNGGGVYLNLSEGLLVNNTFQGNTAVNGGGLFIEAADQDVMLINNIIEGNEAENGGGVYLSGINNTKESVIFSGTIIRNNTGTSGGGMYINYGNPYLFNCRISDNQAETGGGLTAIFKVNQSPSLSNTTITGNKADLGGGILLTGNENYNLDWDHNNRCNLYLNKSFNNTGHDLYASDSTKVYTIIVDTFSILQPANTFAHHVSNFDFDILHGFGEAGDFDIFVSPEGDDNNSGISSEEPLKTIACAQEKTYFDTIPPCRIFLAPGTYSESLTGEKFPVELRSNVSIIGQGPDQTFIDGEFQHQLFYKMNNGKIYLAGMTLHAGNAIGSEIRGGALSSVSAGVIECENMLFDTNLATYGGAIYLETTELNMKNVAFARNKASLRGGAICSINSIQKLENVSFYLNRSNYGGAIYTQEIEAEWKNVSFMENQAARGGALWVTGNFSIKPEKVVMDGNFASYYGGSIFFTVAYGDLGNLMIKNSKSYTGGALQLSNSSINLFDLCMTGNEATINGSVISCTGTTLHMENLTLSDNLVPSSDGGMLTLAGYSTVTILNSVLWNNNQQKIRLLNTSSLTSSYNDIQGGQEIVVYGPDCAVNWLEGNIDTDPLFEGAGDHPYQLSAGSPCIDAGNPDTTVMVLPFWDLIGNYRLWDGDGDGDTIVDVGAYEFGSVGVGVQSAVVSRQSSVMCYPNPTSGIVDFRLSMADGRWVSLKVYDLQGREVAVVVDGRWTGGQVVRWDASGLPAGVYYYRLTTKDQRPTSGKIVKY